MLSSWILKTKFYKLKGMSFDDSFYQEVTDENWKVLTSSSPIRQQSKKNTELVTPQDILLMQTNVLSQIPECFDLSSPNVPIKQDKKNRPPKTQVFVQKRSKNEPLVRTKSDEEKIKHIQKKNKRVENDQNPSEPRRYTDFKQPENYTYQKTKSKIQLKTKTKIKRSNWRSKSAPNLHGDGITSCTEYSQETNISFAAYVKKRTPNLSPTKTKRKDQKLRRFQGSENINLVGFQGKDDTLKSASKRNVTFNPIFEEERERSRDNYVKLGKRARDYQVGYPIDEVSKDEACDIHVSSTQNVGTDHVESDVQQYKLSSYDEEDDVPVTCIDDVIAEFKENYVPITCIDDENSNNDIEVTCIDDVISPSDVPVSCIDQIDEPIPCIDYENNDDHVPVTCIDEIHEDEDHVDNHVNQRTLIRQGRLHDLDLYNWYGDEYQDFDDEEDSFENRMLRRTATILSFDLTSRRRELYTIKEQPNEEE